MRYPCTVVPCAAVPCERTAVDDIVLLICGHDGRCGQVRLRYGLWTMNHAQKTKVGHLWLCSHACDVRRVKSFCALGNQVASSLRLRERDAHPGIARDDLPAHSQCDHPSLITHYSPFTIPHSQLAIHQALLILRQTSCNIQCAIFAIHRSLLTHHARIITHHKAFLIHRSCII